MEGLITSKEDKVACGIIMGVPHPGLYLLLQSPNLEDLFEEHAAHCKMCKQKIIDVRSVGYNQMSSKARDNYLRQVEECLNRVDPDGMVRANFQNR